MRFPNFYGCSHLNQLVTMKLSRGLETGRLCLFNSSAKSATEEQRSHPTQKVVQVQNAINSQVHAMLKASPFEVVFGTKLHSQADGRLLLVPNEELVAQFIDERKKLHDQVKQNFEKAQQVFKSNFDKNVELGTDTEWEIW